jgi:hypothetical protein
MIEQPTDPSNSMEPHMVDPTYTEADDPAINLLSGPGDLSKSNFPLDISPKRMIDWRRN